MLNEPKEKLVSNAAHTTRAIVFEAPKRLELKELELCLPEPGQVRVEVEWSGISTGTEKLLWDGAMPPFPGMGYPLVPGYETVGRIAEIGQDAERQVGERVFVSGARCFGDVRGLFGGAASSVVVDADKTLPLPDALGEEAILLALAATAHHAVCESPPDLIVGHGVLGRLMARLGIALHGVKPKVWEIDEGRQRGAHGYSVVHPDADTERGYGCIMDASGDAGILNSLIDRLRKGGEIVLCGFYAAPLSFNFPPAFMREATIRVAAEWQPSDLTAVGELVTRGDLSLADLISHRAIPAEASEAYPIAFFDPDCLKMVLDWRQH